MKANEGPEDGRSLDRILSQWRVETPLPPRFQERVWQRIERAESQPATPFRVSAARLIEAIVPRPRLAYSYATILLAVGLVAGAWAAEAQNNRTEASLGSRYLQSVDPYQGGAYGR
jgi:hypothetical protein